MLIVHCVFLILVAEVITMLAACVCLGFVLCWHLQGCVIPCGIDWVPWVVCGSCGLCDLTMVACVVNMFVVYTLQA